MHFRFTRTAGANLQDGWQRVNPGSARQRAWPLLALIAVLVTGWLQPPHSVAAGAALRAVRECALVIDGATGSDRTAVRPDAPIEAQAPKHKRLGASPGASPKVVAALSDVRGQPCRNDVADEAAPRAAGTSSFDTLVAQPRAPPISRT
jgi:hypothetical protein